VIFSYDEAGGFYDHVPPPPLDSITVTAASQGVEPGTYALGRGFRVPAMVISPFARKGAIVSDVYDHTSALALIEARFGIPALTAIDAAADPFTECFDFATPQPPVTIDMPDPTAGFAGCAPILPAAAISLINEGGFGIPAPTARTYELSPACASAVGGSAGGPGAAPDGGQLPATGDDPSRAALGGALVAAATAARSFSRK
jgi:phospholipase C